MNSIKTKATSLLVAIACAACATTASAGTVSALFDDGVTTTSVDGWTGASGNGWNTAWIVNGTGVISANNTTVSSASPLTSTGGNYLAASYVSGGNQAGFFAVRSYAAGTTATAINTTQTHTTSFQFRLDSPVSSRSLNDSNETIRFFDNNNSGGSSGTATTWQVLVGGNSGTPQSTLSFNVIAGTGAGGGATTVINTGMQIVQNITYSISVTVHPVASFNIATSYPTWDVAISNGTGTYTSTGLRFRNDAITSGRFFEVQGIENTSSTTLSYSLDDLIITNAVPEPASLAITAFGALVMIRRRS